MPQATTVLKGVVHGRTIELDQESGLPDGQEVTMLVRPLLPTGEGIRRSAGGWSDGGEQLDQWQKDVQIERERDRGR